MIDLLLIIVLTSVYMLCAGSDIPIQPDFDVQKVSGKWYPIARVKDRGALKDMEFLESIAKPSDNGDLLITAYYYQNGVCGNNDLHYVHTDEPGKFTGRNSLSTVRVIEADYGSHCIFHIAGVKKNYLHLYSREPQVSDAVREKYMNHVTSLKFPADKIHYEKRTGQCPE